MIVIPTIRRAHATLSRLRNCKKYIPMKHICVLAATAQNPEERLFPQKNTLVFDPTTRLLNDFDLIGVEAAVRLMESGYADDVTVFSLNADRTFIHKALAMGASRAIIADLPDVALTTGIVVREVLKNFPEIDDTLFICGKLNVNFESSQTAQRLAQALACPCIPLAHRIETTATDDLLVFCEDDEGIPCYRVHTPAVLTTDLRLAEPRFPSLPAIMKAKRKPIITLESVESHPDPWDMRTLDLCPTPQNTRACQWLSIQDAAQLLLNTAGNTSSQYTHTSTAAHPYPDATSPLLAYLLAPNERLSGKRLDQLQHLATTWHAQLTFLTSNPMGLPDAQNCDFYVIPLTPHTTFQPISSHAQTILQCLASYKLTALMATHTPLNLRLLAAVASGAHIPFIPNLIAQHGNIARMICAAQLIETLHPVSSPFLATLYDTSPLSLPTPPADHITATPIPQTTLDHFSPADNACAPESARIILSAGRGAIPAFSLLPPLCDRLHATLGASRVVVDAGIIDNAHQIGLTGHTVTPQLYVALGISGAIQHLAGMRNASTILAINTDKNAPIFDIAHYGVLGRVEDFLACFNG